MSKIEDWIAERRRIHDAATEGPWVHDEYTGVEGIVYPDTAFAEAVADCGDRDDSAAIVDAHNTLPALLTAVEQVLELLDDPGGPDSWSHTFQGRHSVFADDVRAAIEEATK